MESCVHCGEADWDKHNEWMDNGFKTPRQLLRAQCGIMTEDALSQLEQCFIFDFKLAWSAFKYGLKCFLTYTCRACGRHHWSKKPILRSDGSNGGCCGYGYKETLKNWYRQWYWSGKHGDD